MESNSSHIETNSTKTLTMVFKRCRHKYCHLMVHLTRQTCSTRAYYKSNWGTNYRERLKVSPNNFEIDNCIYTRIYAIIKLIWNRNKPTMELIIFYKNFFFDEETMAKFPNKKKNAFFFFFFGPKFFFFYFNCKYEFTTNHI